MPRSRVTISSYQKPKAERNVFTIKTVQRILRRCDATRFGIVKKVDWSFLSRRNGALTLDAFFTDSHKSDRWHDA